LQHKKESDDAAREEWQGGARGVIRSGLGAVTSGPKLTFVFSA